MMSDTPARTPIFDAIRRRRVARAFSDQPVERALLQRLVETGRWAPSAGNRRIHIFGIVDDALLIRKLRMLSPGMLGSPPALITICTDWQRAGQAGVKCDDLTVWIDVGTVTQNMLLAAYEMGLGAGPVTSFSRSGVQVLLRLPGHVTPALMVCLGYTVPQPRVTRPGAGTPIRLSDLTFWNTYAQQDTQDHADRH